MKNVMLGLCLLGLTSLAFAQTTPQNGNDSDVEEVQLTGVTISPLNLSYLNKVQDPHTPEEVVQLENTAARYDIKRSDVFDGSFEAYEVIFEQTDGGIVATYDREGKITSSLERFKNVALPVHIREMVYKNNPGWTITKDAYIVSYYEDLEEVQKIYKLQLKKGKQKKTLKCDSEGNML